MKNSNLSFDFVQDGELVEPVYAVSVCARLEYTIYRVFVWIFVLNILDFKNLNLFRNYESQASMCAV